jgi:CheY-like chemotaxis protein
MTQPRIASPRILVVEDEAVVRLALADALHDLGFAVDATGSAGAALERLRQLGDDIEAAILDIGLPDRPGDALACELRARYAALPIVIATGDTGEEVRQRFQGDRRTAFMPKPYDEASLRRLLTMLGVEIPTPEDA